VSFFAPEYRPKGDIRSDPPEAAGEHPLRPDDSCRLNESGDTGGLCGPAGGSGTSGLRKRLYDSPACRNWDDIHNISVPVLSAKERFKLDGNLNKSVKRMLTALRFFPSDDEPSSLAAVGNYKKLQRFYPAFRHVDD
jgi:hypothetical protein